MRLSYIAAIAAEISLLALPPLIVSAGPSWQPATATMVSAGITSKSTFGIQAYVTLPTQCDTARIRTLSMTTEMHRSFTVEQMGQSSSCSGKTMYKCTVVSPNFRLPMQHKFEVESKGKTWEVELGAQAPQPMEPMCRKS